MTSKVQWDEQEERMLRALVQNQVKINWMSVAAKINVAFSGRQKTAKQCRERYVNYTKFDDGVLGVKNDWTREQEMQMYNLYRLNGSKWSKIATEIPFKSENSIKNKFYGNLRKTLRKINGIGKANVANFNKCIKYETIIKIIDASQGLLQLPLELTELSEILKQKFLTFCMQSFKADMENEYIEFIRLIHKFNKLTRCYRMKKKGRAKKDDKCQQKKPISQPKLRKQMRMENCFDMPSELKTKYSAEFQKCQPSANGRTKQNENLIENITRTELKPDATFPEKYLQILPQSPVHSCSRSRPSNNLEQQFYQIIGEEFIPSSFDYFEQ